MAAGRLLDAVDALAEANRRLPDPALERRLVRLRRDAFASLDRTPRMPPDLGIAAEPAPPGPCEITPDRLDRTMLARGIRQHGALLVRGLVPEARVARLRAAIDGAFEGQVIASAAGVTPAIAPWCDPLDGIPDGEAHRFMVRAAHGVLTVDSPRALAELLHTFHALGLDALIASYLGERPVLAAKKCTLRRIDPGDWKVAVSNWHQDGAFLGEGIRTVNVWVALSRCGRDAPGLEILPLRLDRLLPRGGPGADFDWTVSRDVIARELPGIPIWEPLFEPGDVLFFDDWLLHRTAARPGMPHVRYSVECWLFAPSTYVDPASTGIVV